MKAGNRAKPLSIGARFGRLVTLEETRLNQRVAYVCQCDCGQKTTSRATDLRLEKTMSCGCYAKERQKESGRANKGQEIVIGEKYSGWTITKIVSDVHPRTVECVCVCGKIGSHYFNALLHGRPKSCGCLTPKTIIHGMTNTATWRSWSLMKRRCLNPKDKDWHRYGNRGIKTCERWMDFQNFLADMGVRPDNTTLDRIDNNGDYEPHNCRWSTITEQNRNQSQTKLDTGKINEIMCLAVMGVSKKDIAERFNIGHGHVSMILSGKIWGGRSRGEDYTHISWRSMLERVKSTHYRIKGITVHPDWYNYQTFLIDMGPRPPGTTIDRINNSDIYRNGNCRWATKVQQANNRGDK